MTDRDITLLDRICGLLVDNRALVQPDGGLVFTLAGEVRNLSSELGQKPKIGRRLLPDDAVLQLCRAAGHLSEAMSSLSVASPDPASESGRYLILATDCIFRAVRLLANGAIAGQVPVNMVNEYRTTMMGALDQGRETLRRWIVLNPAVVDLLAPEVVEDVMTVRISPLAYLCSMCNLFWSAIRHPLSATTIDLSTGRVLYRT